MTKHRICTICHKPIVLVPSAAERAEKYGGTADYYKNLFLQHGTCAVEQRSQQSRELMQRLTRR